MLDQLRVVIAECSRRKQNGPAIDRAVVDQELFGQTAFVEGGANRTDQGVDVFFEEELAVTEYSAGVVDECDQPSLFRFPGLRSAGNEGAEHGVGLPQLIGILHAEGEPFAVLLRLGFQQIVFANEAAERGAGDLLASQQAVLDAEAIDAAFSEIRS